MLLSWARVVSSRFWFWSCCSISVIRTYTSVDTWCIPVRGWVRTLISCCRLPCTCSMRSLVSADTSMFPIGRIGLSLRGLSGMAWGLESCGITSGGMGSGLPHLGVHSHLGHVILLQVKQFVGGIMRLSGWWQLK